MANPLTTRLLAPPDEPALRAFWAEQPEAHLFAIPDLDFLGWYEPMLQFRGWFDGATLVGYLMLYGVSAQWSYRDERVAPAIALLLAERKAQFITGMESSAWPVLHALPPGTVQRHEPSTVAMLPPDRFNAATLHATPGQARSATLNDLDDLAAVHSAAPDQFNNFDFATRRRALRSALTDGWRRISLAQSATGQIVAAAQSTAEGRAMAVIGGVVTHPAHRGHGYATAATAHLCAALLESGRVPYLFYRRDNASAARVYEKIGFIPLGDALLAELRWH